MKNPRKETIEKLFLALTEFHRALGTKSAQSVNYYMNQHNVPVNLHRFIKDELITRHLIDKEFTKWSTERTIPTMVLAESMLRAAYDSFNEHKAERPSAQQPRENKLKELIAEHVNALKALGAKEVTLTF
jgi:hypothetical protein